MPIRIKNKRGGLSYVGGDYPYTDVSVENSDGGASWNEDGEIARHRIKNTINIYGDNPQIENRGNATLNVIEGKYY
ncbi:MAG: hypothetical protein FWG65_08380 [Turicibacter sp.]|nr:hypothetical protein [Turicibacter sp.]